MGILTPDELREHVETALDDVALQRILDGAEADMAVHGGTLTATLDAPDDVTEVFYPAPKTLYLTLASRAEAITSVTVDAVELDAADYEVHRGNELHLVSGYYWYWTDDIVVVYEPTLEELQRRRMALVNLCKLYINADPGTSFQGAATWQTTVSDFEEQKQRVLWAWKRPPVFA
jgi:hypothetical protein